MLNNIAGQLTGGVTVAPNSYESIETYVVGSGGQSSITFASIPSTYKHLQIRYTARSNNASTLNGGTGIRFNSDSGSNYASHDLTGDGASATAGSFTSQSYMFGYLLAGGSAGANTFGTGIIDILDYTSTNKYKTVRTLSGSDNNGSGSIKLSSGLWMNTSAITNIFIDNRDGNSYAQYSSFALYGIKG